MRNMLKIRKWDSDEEAKASIDFLKKNKAVIADLYRISTEKVEIQIEKAEKKLIEKEAKVEMTKEEREKITIEMYETENMLSRIVEHIVDEDDVIVIDELEYEKEKKTVELNALRSKLGLELESEKAIDGKIESKKTHNATIESETYVSEEIKNWGNGLVYCFSKKHANVYRETQKAYELKINDNYYWIPRKGCFVDKNKTIAIKNYWIIEKDINISNSFATCCS